MSKLIQDLDIATLHQTGGPFDPEQVKRDFRLHGQKKRAETLDIVRARLDSEEASVSRSYSAATRLYTDLLEEHQKLLRNDL
jgi:hypothetical protein